jgi:hypothetical protein
VGVGGERTRTADFYVANGKRRRSLTYKLPQISSPVLPVRVDHS